MQVLSDRYFVYRVSFVVFNSRSRCIDEGENAYSSEEHHKHEYYFRSDAKRGGYSERKPDGRDCRSRFEKTRQEGQFFYRCDRHSADEEKYDIQKEYRDGLFYRLFGDSSFECGSFATSSENRHRRYDKHGERRYFHATRSRPRRAADKHQPRHYRNARVGHFRKIRGVESRRSRRYGLKEGS